MKLHFAVLNCVILGKEYAVEKCDYRPEMLLADDQVQPQKSTICDECASVSDHLKLLISAQARITRIQRNCKST